MEPEWPVCQYGPVCYYHHHSVYITVYITVLTLWGGARNHTKRIVLYFRIRGEKM